MTTATVAAEAATPPRNAKRASTTAAPSTLPAPLVAAPQPTVLEGTVQIAQAALKRGLATVRHAVAAKSALPILANILMATEGDQLRLSATNLQVAITCWYEAKIGGDLLTTVPADLLSDVIGHLPEEPLTLSLDAHTQTLGLRSARFVNAIKGIDAEEFPAIPQPTSAAPLAVLPATVLREMIEQVAFAAATDEARPVLTGVLLRMRGNELTMAATDGFRLACKRIPLASPAASPVQLIIPAHALMQLARVLDKRSEPVTITADATAQDGAELNQVTFTTETVEVVIRLRAGNYPDFERIIPSKATTRGVVDRQALLEAVKLAALFATASQNIVKLTLSQGDPGRLSISANASEVGDTLGEVDAHVTGEEGVIALNVRFLLDALNAITTPEVALELQTLRSPGVIAPVGQEGYCSLIMPMTTR